MTRRNFDHAGYDPNCACCLVVANPAGCRANGHRPITAAERDAARARALADAASRGPLCPVCRSELCATRRREGRPLLCD